MSALRTHALLMITAWMFCASLGLIIARFYRNLPGSLLGQKPWFIVHIVMMAASVSLTMVAFILVFVYAKSWWYSLDYTGAHPYIGISVLACVILNPILAIFRPRVSSRYRVVYNWIHWATGKSAFLLAFFNIFIGLAMYEVTGAVWWLILALAIVHYVTEAVVDKLHVEHEKIPTEGALLSEVHEHLADDIEFTGHLHPGRKTSLFLYGVLVIYIATQLSLWITVIILFP